MEIFFVMPYVVFIFYWDEMPWKKAIFTNIKLDLKMRKILKFLLFDVYNYDSRFNLYSIKVEGFTHEASINFNKMIKQKIIYKLSLQKAVIFFCCCINIISLDDTL